MSRRKAIAEEEAPSLDELAGDLEDEDLGGDAGDDEGGDDFDFTDHQAAQGAAALNDPDVRALPPAPAINAPRQSTARDMPDIFTSTPQSFGRESSPRLYAQAAQHPACVQLRVWKVENGLPVGIGTIDAEATEEDFITRFYPAMPGEDDTRAAFRLRPIDQSGNPLGQEFMHNIHPQHTELVRLRRKAQRALESGTSTNGNGSGNGVTVVRTSDGSAAAMSEMSRMTEHLMASLEEQAERARAEAEEMRERARQDELQRAQERVDLASNSATTVQAIMANALESERIRSQQLAEDRKTDSAKVIDTLTAVFGQSNTMLQQQMMQQRAADEDRANRERQRREEERSDAEFRLQRERAEAEARAQRERADVELRAQRDRDALEARLREMKAESEARMAQIRVEAEERAKSAKDESERRTQAEQMRLDLLREQMDAQFKREQMMLEERRRADEERLRQEKEERDRRERAEKEERERRDRVEREERELRERREREDREARERRDREDREAREKWAAMMQEQAESRRREHERQLAEAQARREEREREERRREEEWRAKMLESEAERRRDHERQLAEAQARREEREREQARISEESRKREHEMQLKRMEAQEQRDREHQERLARMTERELSVRSGGTGLEGLAQTFSVLKTTLGIDVAEVIPQLLAPKSEESKGTDWGAVIPAALGAIGQFAQAYAEMQKAQQGQTPARQQPPMLPQYVVPPGYVPAGTAPAPVPVAAQAAFNPGMQPVMQPAPQASQPQAAAPAQAPQQQPQTPPAQASTPTPPGDVVAESASRSKQLQELALQKGLKLPAQRNARRALRKLVADLEKETDQDKWTGILSAAVAVELSIYHYVKAISVTAALEEAGASPETTARVIQAMRQSPAIPSDVPYVEEDLNTYEKE